METKKAQESVALSSKFYESAVLGRAKEKLGKLKRVNIGLAKGFLMRPWLKG